MNYLFPIPFFIELIADWWLIKKGKKDITSLWRAIMILLVSIESIEGEWRELDFVLSGNSLILSVSLFIFFDPLLNKLRGRKWYAPGKTKKWDIFLSEYNSFFIFSVRVLIFGLCIWYVW